MTPRDEYGDPTGERTPELLRKLARDRGSAAIFADASMIQVDLDAPSLDRFHQSYELLKEQGYLEGSEAVAWHSKGGNWHVMVLLPEGMEVTAQQRIMYALMLGSDPTREILNMAEARDASGTIVLFRPVGSIEFRVDGRSMSDNLRRRGTRQDRKEYTL